MEPAIGSGDHGVAERTAAAAADLRAVRARRVELRETLGIVEGALAAPALGRAQAWGEHVHAALALLAEDFAAHVRVTEGPDGLHQAILAGDLRLTNAVDALTRDHGRIATALSGLVASSVAVVDDDVDALRERATALFGDLLRHRQRGADLIYTAYQTDIGGGD